MTVGARALIADVGGTHLRMALAEGGICGAVETRLLDEVGDLAATLHGFCAAQGAMPARAVLAVAGPVEGDCARLTNRGWLIDARALGAALGVPAPVLVNDFAAVALALPYLSGADLLPLGGGAGDAATPRAVLGPGTGLGVAALLADGTVLATEGGHATLAAMDAEEEAVIGILRRRFGHASAERALSGPGLEALHLALAELQGVAGPSLRAPAIVAQGLAGDCALCRATLELFCGLLGGVAGSLALTYGARAGVFLAGGIPPRLAGILPGSRFRARFEAKGRFRPWLEGVPAWLVARPDPAMVGLAAFSARP